MLLDLLSRTDRLPVARLLACTPKTDRPFFDLCADGRTLLRLKQEGTSLGERMKQALAWGFGQGFTRIVLIGCDSPDLPIDFIREGFARLRTVSCVVGPTQDGGYYLIGARDAIPPVFDRIQWGSSDVMTETLRHLKNNAVSFHPLPLWYDIDRPADLTSLMARIQSLISNSQQAPEKTSAYLNHLKQIGRLTM